MTTRIITSERPVVEVKGYDYRISKLELSLINFPRDPEKVIRKLLEDEVKIPKEAVCVRTDNKDQMLVLFRWTWFEITIKDS